MRIAKSKWFLPLFAVAGGALVFVAQWIGGDPKGGLVSFAILTAFGAFVLLGGCSETIRGLRGDGRDERFRQIDIHANRNRRSRLDQRDHHRLDRRTRPRTQRGSLRLACCDRGHRLARRDRHLSNPRLNDPPASRPHHLTFLRGEGVA